MLQVFILRKESYDHTFLVEETGYTDLDLGVTDEVDIDFLTTGGSVTIAGSDFAYRGLIIIITYY